MGSMKQYKVTLTGQTPLLMHKDNFVFAEKVSVWSRKPENKPLTVPGDDRTPPWTWIGYLYHNGRIIGVDADNIMTMLREGGAKVSTGRGKETFKKVTQSGVIVDSQQFDLFVRGKTISIDKISKLIGNLNFNEHIDLAESFGFELFCKRAKIGKSKHIRNRPMFREWKLVGTITVIDEVSSGITKDILDTILRFAGSKCGLCDWRPSSPSSGSYGRFTHEIELVD